MGVVGQMSYRAVGEECQKDTLVYSATPPYVRGSKGHQMIEQQTSGFPETQTVSNARDMTVTSSTFTSSDRIAVPPHAVEILRDCINGRKADPVVHERIREALALIGDEAHRSDAKPEHLLVAIKELCHSMPEYEKICGAWERDAFLNTLVTVGIEEYYRV